MTCGELEVLLPDYLDGALDAGGRRTVEEHLAGCATCAGLARDAAGATAFIERAAVPEPPPALIARILNETASGRLGNARGLRGWIEKALGPVLQPRLVMGMALTVLSFSMMARCAGVSPREIKPADMHPAKVWAALDDRVHRAWARSVKFYEDIKFVYEIQTQLREWNEQQSEEDRAAAAKKSVSDRQVIVDEGKEVGRE
jgi:anti-sigma factor RsiW